VRAATVCNAATAPDRQVKAAEHTISCGRMVRS
jgi:hypothetical protein